jgi:poly-gamma-glutamate capsule biosynthesis protein CapA/YwtB (metallophosphatase superfamily)
VKLFLAGDVMTGRGLDQAMPTPVDPALHEPHVRSAVRYVELAEAAHGPIPRPAGPRYFWGDALAALESAAPDARIINLETAITTSDDWWPTKAIHYRMHPAHVPVLQAAGVDVCTLANNHVLDWGRDGLRETLEVLARAGIATAGAGLDDGAAETPAVASTRAGRLLVFAWGTPGAGVPGSWQAGPDTPGVSFLSEGGEAGAARIVDGVRRHRRDGDRVVVSIHWGPNWGYGIPEEQRQVGRSLVDSGVVDVVFGHSSHHPRGIEVYRGRPIVYGAGDLLNDYEGISGYEAFRGDLALLYFPELAATGELRRFTLVPFRIRRFRLERPTRDDADWVAERMDRECGRLDARVERRPDGRLELLW